jgi:hypothetical protein
MSVLIRDGASANPYPQLAADSGCRRQVALILGGLTSGLALSIYLATLAPDLSWRHQSYDGGELITAAVTLGIPHPPGYPTYVLLGKLISLIPAGPVAFRFNLFSAACTAIAAGFLTMTIVHRFSSHEDQISAKSGVAALAAGLAFALTPLVWSQAIITEVYGLNLTLLAGFLWALIARRGYQTAGLLLGLSVTSHLTSLFFLPLAFGLTPRPKWRKLVPWFVGGLAPLAAIPLLVRTDSPVVWGEPIGLQSWWWLISGRLYHSNLHFPSQAEHVQQVLAAWLAQFGWLGLPLALFGALMRPDSLQNLLTLLTAGLYVGYALLYHTADAAILLLPALLFMAFLMAPALRQAGVGGLALPITLLLVNFQALNASDDHQVRPIAESILMSAPDQAILLTPGDRSIFSFWYFHHVEKQRRDVILVDSNLFAFSWYRQRLGQRYPELRGVEMDNLVAFQQLNEERRPFCRVNLVENDSGPPGVRC